MDMLALLKSFGNGFLHMDWKAWAAISVIPLLKGYRWFRVRWKGEGKWK